MSIVICNECVRWIDTDYERSFYNKKNNESSCENCVSELSDEELEENYYE